MTVPWGQVPAAVRAVVERHVGPAVEADDVVGGAGSDLAAVVRGTRPDSVFVKAVHGVSRRMRFLRNEITAGRYAAGVAPRVLFHADVDGWLIVGFEHVAGRPAQLRPGSPDLALIAATIDQLGRVPAGSLRPLRDRWSTTHWWTTLADEHPRWVDGWDVAIADKWAGMLPELVDGDRLVHTDPHADQFLITSDGQVRMVDWAFPGSGAQWVDAAFLILRLIDAGHSPASAEYWARGLSHWPGDDADILTAFACYIAGMWSHWAAAADDPGTRHRANLARGYASARLVG